jgi:hypothetical protein
VWVSMTILREDLAEDIHDEVLGLGGNHAAIKWPGLSVSRSSTTGTA